MQEHDYIDCIERRNERLLLSIRNPSLTRKERLQRITKKLCRLHPRETIQLLSKKIAYHRTKKLEGSIVCTSFEGPRGIDPDFDFTQKIVIYSCVTDGYDTPRAPQYMQKNERFIFYHDNATPEAPYPWENRRISSMHDGTNLNRYYKMHPFDLFQGYDFAIYVDGSIEITSDITILCSIAKESKLGIASHTHSERNCVYTEAEACKLLKRGDPSRIEQQMNRYRAEGFPSHFGLLEAGVLVTDLHNTNAKRIYSDWWSDFIEAKSRRDQLSLPYVLWKNNRSLKDLGFLGNDLMLNPKFHLHTHPKK